MRVSFRRLCLLTALLSVFPFTGLRAGDYISCRPAVKDRLFVSRVVDKTVAEVQRKLRNPKLAWMFGNCFPNTLDTTVHFSDSAGVARTFVYTGDIHAMWLRDSSAQVWPYIPLAPKDKHLARMLAGLIMQQSELINIDAYANAFNASPLPGGEWMSDLTDMNPRDHERKWEIDSLCYPLYLAWEYWKTTGDISCFGSDWLKAMRRTLEVFREQQRKTSRGSYHFERRTTRPTDTQAGNGWGNPVRATGMICSAFRPSDDATTYLYLIPSNLFAVSALKKASEIVDRVYSLTSLSDSLRSLATEVHDAVYKYGIFTHPKYGRIFAFETDGYGNALFMDDANVPSLLSLPYLGAVSLHDSIYMNTRRFVLSEDNPYFFRGRAGEGIGGPHIGMDYIWPMSIMMRAYTSADDAEISYCMKMLLSTDDNTGFIHESFHKDDPHKFTRKWFAWQNSLFGGLIMKLIEEGKLNLLNNI